MGDGASVPTTLGVVSGDVLDDAAVPYWSWDRSLTNREIRALLRGNDPVERRYWTARILREARYADVWAYLDVDAEVVPHLAELAPMLGRRRAFWEWLIGEWRARGMIDG